MYSAVSGSEHRSALGTAVGEKASSTLAEKLRLNGTYPSPEGLCAYGSRRVPLGFTLMFGAGTLSGLLGIGSGAVKVLAMDRAMGLPFKVSTTTSNFMIGVTAAASAGVYLTPGYVDPGLAMPVMLGVLGGALAGSKLLISAPVSILRWVFRGVLAVLAIEIIYSGLTGGCNVRWSDEQVEQWMGRVLQIGVAIAALIIFIGGVVYPVHVGGERPDYGNFHDVAPG